MKNLISVLALIMFLTNMMFLRESDCSGVVPIDAKLIEETCRKTQNYNLCVSVLKSDPRSANASVAGLALIMVDEAKAKATITLEKTNELLKQHPRDQSLKDCAHGYNVIITEYFSEINMAVLKCYYEVAVDALDKISSLPPACDVSFKGNPILIDLGNGMTEAAMVALAIVMILV